MAENNNLNANKNKITNTNRLVNKLVEMEAILNNSKKGKIELNFNKDNTSASITVYY